MRQITYDVQGRYACHGRVLREDRIANGQIVYTVERTHSGHGRKLMRPIIERVNQQRVRRDGGEEGT